MSESIFPVSLDFNGWKPVSASQIVEKPFAFWEFIPGPVRPYFVKKICLVGTQSTGKSILTEKLAKHYDTVFVDEVGREVVPVTEDSTMELLLKIAVEHAQKIIEKSKEADKLLFIDTDQLPPCAICTSICG